MKQLNCWFRVFCTAQSRCTKVLNVEFKFGKDHRKFIESQNLQKLNIWSVFLKRYFYVWKELKLKKGPEMLTMNLKCFPTNWKDHGIWHFPETEKVKSYHFLIFPSEKLTVFLKLFLQFKPLSFSLKKLFLSHKKTRPTMAVLEEKFLLENKKIFAVTHQISDKFETA